MSFDHKAFQFDWESFLSELALPMNQALAQDDAAPLRRFVEINRSQCSSPYDGEPLDLNWQALLEAGDVQEFADFALTKYYKPNDDFGIGGIWLELTDSLDPRQKHALLGQPFGLSNAPFDPGRQGSYFQTPAEVKQSLLDLSRSGKADIAVFHRNLVSVAANGKGLYVTF